MKKSALLIGVDYETVGDSAVIKLLLKGEKFFVAYDKSLKPYFYIETNEHIVPGKFGGCQIVSVEEVERVFGRETKRLKKIVCRHPREIVALSGQLARYGKIYEADIPFAQRYIIDRGLVPMNVVELELDGDEVKTIRDCGQAAPSPSLRALCFDIEVYAPQIVPREKVDPIIIISYCDDEGAKAITWGYSDGTTIAVEDEASAIKAFCEVVAQKDVDLLVGYNSASFDLPYLLARAHVLGTVLALGRDGSEPELRRTAMTTRVRLSGRTHIDVFYTVRLLAAAQALRTQRYTLEEVYRELIGKEKFDLEEFEMRAAWDDSTRRREYVKYALSDAVATSELFALLFPLHVELARLARMPLSDVSGVTSGQLVESLLIAAAAARGLAIPSKPGSAELSVREREPIAGAYVRIPEPGIYEHIAVLDFRSLYPSIIVARNISPETLDCGHAECAATNTSPTGHHFCILREGFIPSVLRELIAARRAAKAELRASGSATARARVAALKIITNSFYGMLRYPRARWYTREGAEAVTAWGRHYIRDVERKAEESGFKVLYIDTDSVFLLLNGKNEDDVVSFVERINAALPPAMELELEGIYARGLFVAKKQERTTKGAKKKYALITKDGKIKIRGFELVRRDWSKIARDTQTAVLAAILKEGSKERALAVVKDTIARLKEGKVAKDELTIYTQLRKTKYEVLSPELSAVKKARQRGLKIKSGAIIGYVVTKGKGEKVSERAELAQLAQDYDPDYYINSQIIPAVLKILGELGYSEDDIKYLSKQSSLEEYLV